MKKYLTLTILVFLLCSCKTKSYTVTFIDNNTELASISVKKGDNIKDIDTPEKEGYIFQAWQKDGFDYDVSTPIKEDITLNAIWVEEPNLPNTHKVTFDFGTYKKTQTIFDGECAQEPKETPKVEKYTFIGWYYENELFDFSTKIEKDIILTAKFNKTRITINYDLDGGSGTAKVEIDKGTVPKKPKNPEKFGYTFKYWMINNNKYDFNKALYEDTTIKAYYEANVYVRVSFDTDGGNIINSKMIIQGETIKELPIPEKENYIFKYWEFEGEEFSIDTKIEKPITLLAIYEAIEEEENNE